MKYLALLLPLVLISGCSWFGDDDEDAAIEPAKLVDFDEEVDIRNVWNASAGAGVKDYLASLSPAASSDTVFVADHEGRVTALGLEKGKKKWKRELDAPLSGGVGYGAGLVLVGSLEGKVYALEADTGKVRWTSEVSSEVLASPAANASVVVVKSIDAHLYALDTQTGAQLWRHDDESPILTLRGNSAPLVTDTMVLAGFDSGKLIAFHPENGAVLWETRIALPQGKTELERMVDIDGQPLLVGDVIYATSYQGRLGALSRGTGRSLWFQDSSSSHVVAAVDNLVFLSDDKDAVRAFKAGNGQQVWSNDKLFLRRCTGPVIFDGYVAVADADGYLHLLDSGDGHFVGREKVDGSGIRTPLLTVGNMLIAQANDGSVSAYRVKRRK